MTSTHSTDPADLAPADRFCTACRQPLRRRFVWLELDQRTGRFHDSGGVPEAESQGWFPFGRDCAARLKAEAVAKAG